RAGRSFAQPAETLREGLEPVAAAPGGDALVGRDPEQPGSGIVALEAVQPAPGAHERLLDHVLGQLLVAHDQAGRPQDLEAVARNDLGEGLPVATAAAVDDALEGGVHCD